MALFVPVALFGIAMPHPTPGLAAIMASSELPCGIALSTLVLGEPVEALQVAGAVAIPAGTNISQLPHLGRRSDIGEGRGAAPRPALRDTPRAAPAADRARRPRRERPEGRRRPNSSSRAATACA
ncbi:MAG: hypothetical protein ACLSVD_13590 [Eggerthellaceae bacterium]